MFKELHIKGFRCFKELSVAPLGRVNLIVGKNSAGKTAVLDALELLVGTAPLSLLRGLVRRQETTRRTVESPGSPETLYHLANVENLFHGRGLASNAAFSITGNEKGWAAALFQPSITVNVGQTKNQQHPAELGLMITTGLFLQPVLPLLADGKLGYSPAQLTAQDKSQVRYLGTQVPDVPYLSSLWDEILLTDDESLTVDALRIIEPRVERIAFRGEGLDRNILVKLRSERSPFLLGSLGEGMRRLLALALHLAPAKSTYLLIDEIDTGLHYSVQAAMWRLVIETAKKLNIQVFATTHSLDCIHALAEVQKQLQLTPEDLMLHRLEPGMDRTISYAPEEIAVAAERQIEVR